MAMWLNGGWGLGEKLEASVLHFKENEKTLLNAFYSPLDRNDFISKKKNSNVL